MNEPDALRIHFDARGVVARELTLGFILFGIALDTRPADLRAGRTWPRWGWHRST